jgi:hypothetical protein
MYFGRYQEFLHVKNHPEKKPLSKKNSTVSDGESDSLSETVEFFLTAVFLGVNFYMETPASEFCQGHSSIRIRQVSAGPL